MGAVYRAMDRLTGAAVALKVMACRRGDEERFAQEARVLAELNHPTIVRYVTHGETAEGHPYLVMEWLDGEDLATRLVRSRLTVGESLEVARRVAEGLAVAHRSGLVHRDVKPSNIRLVDGQPARAKLLDFGIVRMEFSGVAPSGPAMTRTGTVLGTVGYMSPEQAIGDRKLDARADVFALGCVLFECVTGRPAFSGGQVVAVLAKVLREEAPRLRALRPELPAELDALVARMLAKDRSMRPPHAGAVLDELMALGNVAGDAPEGLRFESAGLSAGEQRMTSVILVSASDGLQRLREIVEGYAGDLVRLANSTLLVTLGGRGKATEHVRIAAACALAMRDAQPSARIALATGRADSSSGAPAGPVIDRAASLFTLAAASDIRVDEVTAGLLGELFELRREGQDYTLLGRRDDGESPRTLLGKSVPFVGRDKDLGLLEGTLRECIDESVARAVLVIGPAGQGKSRLGREFLGSARRRGDVRVLVARADPVGAGSAFMMVRQLVRRAVGVHDGDPVDTQHGMLRAYIGRVCAGTDPGRISDFLGELIGTPSSEYASPELRSARNDPTIMAEWLRRSFGEWLAAECAERPLLLIFEDLHWGDLPSMTYVIEALRLLAARPLMILALARPEVHDALPTLRQAKAMRELRLEGLSPRAAERLVKAALGDGATPDTITRLVERADGNPFYLEELVRRVVEDGGDALPETVLALVHSRLDGLPPEARRLLRAASVFGEMFRRDAIGALLGEASGVGDLDGWLTWLVDHEVFVPARETRFPRAHEYAFRHGLLREAAYAMLTESDKTMGHRLAGEWLETAGEKDPLTMADHFERGGDSARAVRWLMSAAHDLHDPAGATRALQRAFRVLKSLPSTLESGTTLARTTYELVRVGCALGHTAETLQYLDEFDRSIPEKTAEQAAALDSSRARLAYVQGDLPHAMQLAVRCLERLPAADDLRAYRCFPANVVGRARCISGRFGEAVELLTHGCELAREGREYTELSHSEGLLGVSHAFTGDFASGWQHVLSSMDLARRLGDPLRIMGAHVYRAAVCEAKFDWQQGVRDTTDLLAFAEEQSIGGLYLYVGTVFTGRHQFHIGNLGRARVLLANAINLSVMLGMASIRSWAHAWLGDVHFALGHLEEARQQYAAGIALARSTQGDELAEPLCLAGLAHIGALGSAPVAEIRIQTEAAAGRLRAASNRSTLVPVLQRCAAAFAAIGEHEATRRLLAQRAEIVGSLGLQECESWPSLDSPPSSVFAPAAQAYRAQHSVETTGRDPLALDATLRLGPETPKPSDAAVRTRTLMDSLASVEGFVPSFCVR